MNAPAEDPRLDRLYDLLPAIYRMRDAGRGWPLRALLRVIAEQVNVLEDDIERLYDNWFIETADDWVVPYLGDLIGYTPVAEAGLLGDVQTERGRALNRVLVPQRELCNTLRYRRRKGTLALLELLAGDVAGWPARAVEFFKLLGWNQNLNHPHLNRARVVDVRRVDDLALLGTPFDPVARSVDVRRINSRHTTGRHNIPSIGLFVWRLPVFSVTHAPAYCVETAGPHCLTFSVLGQDAPLYLQPTPESTPEQIAQEMNVPAPIRRHALLKSKELFYGVEKSFAIWAEGWGGYPAHQPLPAHAVVAADLTDWSYQPREKHVAVDPVLGRIAFPTGHLPRKGVRVTYHYAFSAPMGGGEYQRPIFHPAPVEGVEATLYRVGEKEAYHRLGDALRAWRRQKPQHAVIELAESGVFVEPVGIALPDGQSLQLRAANGTRPVLRLLDWQTDSPDALSVTMGRGSRLVLDGLVVTGRAVHITGPERAQPADPRAPICGSEIVIRHCTLVPGWGLGHDCEPKRPAEPSLELYHIRARLRIEHSILGSIQIHEDEVRTDPIPVCISDSILDATAPRKEAIGAPGWDVAHALLTIRRCTVFGIVDVHAVELAENCVFHDCVNVARRQIGCMRFCYVPRGCRTPRRYRCQPETAMQTAMEKLTDPAARAQAAELARQRVQPQLNSTRYGEPAYGQLALDCPDEIRRGADDESEMGAFHELYQPQREANLRARLDEYTAAGMNAGVLFAS
jgi:hypothetical protein